MDELTTTPRKESGKGAPLVVGIGVIVLIYFGLLGPCIRFYDVCPGTVQIMIEVVYAPLIWLDPYLPGNPISNYVELWL